MIQLRPYQENIINDVRAEFACGKKRVCIVSGCGSGKTVIMAWMSAQAKIKGNDVLFVIHRQELSDQSSETFSESGISHGIIGAGFPMNPAEKIQIASIQTVIRRLDRINTPVIIILDESHHATANTWKRLLAAYPNAFVIGLTATPARLGGQGLGDIFESLVMGPSVKKLIEDGYLAPFKYYAPPQIANMNGVKVKMGDYDQKQIAEIMDNNVIIGDAVEHYRRLADGKRAIVYCTSVAHSRHTAESFRAAGYAASHIDGDTHKIERRRLVADFKNGGLQIITNCDLISEGFDCPGAEVVILLRPTQSLTLYIQQSMRGMRPDPANPDKVCIILDHVGNVGRHGLPDEDREWSLEGVKKKKAEPGQAFPVRQCPKCYTAHRPTPACPSCGHVYVIEERAEIKKEKGELAEVIDIERIARKREQGRARSESDLIKIAIKRGYEPGWVRRMCSHKGIPFGEEARK